MLFLLERNVCRAQKGARAAAAALFNAQRGCTPPAVPQSATHALLVTNVRGGMPQKVATQAFTALRLSTNAQNVRQGFGARLRSRCQYLALLANTKIKPRKQIAWRALLATLAVPRAALEMQHRRVHQAGPAQKAISSAGYVQADLRAMPLTHLLGLVRLR